MSAAARAAADGASVVLVEKAPAIGGSAMYAGFVWTAPTVDVMREVNPDADPALAALVVERYGEALDWVRSLDVTVGEMVTVLGYGRGCATDMANYLLACERLVRERGELLVKASAQRLLFEDGAVVGAEIRTASGEQREIRARSTLLATGGFGGDPALRAEHILRWRLTFRCAPTRTASVMGFGSACRSEPHSDRRMPASTGTSSPRRWPTATPTSSPT